MHSFPLHQFIFFQKSLWYIINTEKYQYRCLAEKCATNKNCMLRQIITIAIISIIALLFLVVVIKILRYCILQTGNTSHKHYNTTFRKYHEYHLPMKTNAIFIAPKIVLNPKYSDANFLLVKIPKASQLYQYLLTKGIVVRDRSSLENCTDCLRITVGTEQENTELVDAMAKWINFAFANG